MFSMPKKMLYPSRNISSGFTFAELLVVICIMTIVLTVGTPLTYKYIIQRGVRDAADQLAIDLQRARLLAIQRNVNCSITINVPAVNQYTISVTNEVIDLGRYSGAVVFSNAPNVSSPVITFTPQGVCQAAGAIYLTNQNLRYRVRATIAGGISVHLFAGGQWM